MAANLDSDAGAVAAITRCFTVKFERTLPVPADAVWSAISTETEVSRWMGYPASIDRRLGGRFFVDFAPDEPMVGTIFSWKENGGLGHSWGESFVLWELEASETAGTHIVFQHIGVLPQFVCGLGAGWHDFLDRLTAHLTGQSVHSDFEKLTEIYDQLLESEAPGRGQPGNASITVP